MYDVQSMHDMQSMYDVQSMHTVPLEGKTCIIMNSCLRCITAIEGSGSLDAMASDGLLCKMRRVFMLQLLVTTSTCRSTLKQLVASLKMRRVFMLQLLVATSTCRSTLKQLVASLASAHGMW